VLLGEITHTILNACARLTRSGKMKNNTNVDALMTSLARHRCGGGRMIRHGHTVKVVFKYNKSY